VLARGVGGAHRHAGGGEERADVDDHAAAGGQHVAGGGLGAEEGAGQVDRERARPDVDVELLGRRHRADARVVDEDVEAPVLGHGRVEERRDLLGVGDVGHHRRGRAARGSQGLGGGPCERLVAVGDHDGRSLRGQLLGDRRAQAAPRSRDHRDAPLEHGPLVPHGRGGHPAGRPLASAA
jgi:hypothetical protein